MKFALRVVAVLVLLVVAAGLVFLPVSALGGGPADFDFICGVPG